MDHDNGFEGHNSLTYQTSPPATVVMAGNHKEDSPMRIDDLSFNKTNLHSKSTAVGDIKMPKSSLSRNEPSTGDMKLFYDGTPNTMQNGTTIEPEANMVSETGPASNVIVDYSPLQNQMEKNKECKLIFKIF